MMNNDFIMDNEENLFEDLVSFIESEEKAAIDSNRRGSSDYLVYDVRSANFYLQKVSELTEQINRINKLAEEETSRAVEKINIWKDQKIKPLQGYLDYINAGLEDYLKREFESSGNKTKKIKLINGEIKFKKQPNKFTYDDEKLIAQILNTPNLCNKFVQYTPQINKNILKAAGTVIGSKLYIENEAVPGITITSQEDKIVIKTI